MVLLSSTYAQIKTDLFEKGCIKYKMRNYSEALIVFNQIESIDSTVLSDIYYKKSICYKYIGDTVAAKINNDLAKQFNHKYYKNFYIEYYQIGIESNEILHKSIISNLNNEIEDYPKYFNSYFKRGKEKFFIGDYVGALEDFNRSIKLQKGFAWMYYYRGLTFYVLKEDEKAYKDFLKSEKIGNEDAQFALQELFCN